MMSLGVWISAQRGVAPGGGGLGGEGTAALWLSPPPLLPQSPANG